MKKHGLLSLPGRIVRRLRSKAEYRRSVDRIYKEKDYLDAYAKHTDMRVERDPHSAVGPSWEKIGKLQFDYLIELGMKPHHRMLDVGCGTLRGGRHAIEYLDSGNYTGMDLSPKAIDYAHQLVQEEGLSEKQPRLLVSANKDLEFREFDGETFDFLLAQSVFTHLMPEHIEECFRHIVRIMDAGSIFSFTYNRASAHGQTGNKSFVYPWSFFTSLAEKVGVTVEDCADKYDHPHGQRMVTLRRK